MKVLVINSGSSTIKFRVYEAEGAQLRELASGTVGGIGEEVSYIRYRGPRGEVSYEAKVASHEEGMEHVLKVLTHLERGVIEDPLEIVGVGHRVVHGGSEVTGAVVVDEGVEEVIKKYFRMAPLHNPVNLLGIEAAKRVFPRAVHVAVFDTAFHTTIPEEAYLYAIPYELYQRGVRRYGFHGISYSYVSRRASEILGRPLEELKLIICHLGSGASAAAVKYGKCIDTSMGMTPLEGLVMGTRCGDIDPAIFHFLVKWEGMSVDEAYELLNERSGLLGLFGTTGSGKVIEEEYKRGNPAAIRAFKVFAYRVKKYIGAYMAALNGADAIVFTAGIGERSPPLRKLILSDLESLGIKLDERRNEDPAAHGWVISSDDSSVKVLAIPTNEEQVIAEETLKILQKKHLSLPSR